MLHRLRRIGSVVFLLLAVASICYVLVTRWHELKFDPRSQIPECLALAVFVLLAWATSGVQTYLAIRFAGYSIGLWPSIVLALATQFGNYTPYRLGTIVKLRYLKKVWGVGYLEYSGLYAFRLLFVTLAAGVLGTIGLAVGGLQEHRAFPHLVGLIFPALIALSLLAILLIRLIGRDLGECVPHRRFVRHLHAIFRGIQSSRLGWKESLVYFFVIVANFLVITARLYLAFRITGTELSASALLMIGPAVAVTGLVSITPANLGVREWLTAGLATLVGVNLGRGLFATAIDRTLALLLSCVFGSVSLIYILVSTPGESGVERSEPQPGIDEEDSALLEARSRAP